MDENIFRDFLRLKTRKTRNNTHPICDDDYLDRASNLYDTGRREIWLARRVVVDFFVSVNRAFIFSSFSISYINKARNTLNSVVIAKQIYL